MLFSCSLMIRIIYTEILIWNDRPDPTPELYVDESAGFLGSAWRFGKKK